MSDNNFLSKNFKIDFFFRVTLVITFLIIVHNGLSVHNTSRFLWCYNLDTDTVFNLIEFNENK